MPTCFIISPIGDSGTEIRQKADDLRDMLIKPVLEPFGFTIFRGDHHSDAGQIDIDVIQAVQESDLCVVDISMPNPNVYYEFGRRDETGKPIILLKAKDSPGLPLDVATRRYIEYDLSSGKSLIEAHEQLKNFVEPIVQKGFASTGTGTSLSELAEILRRMERKIDRIQGNGRKDAAPIPDSNIDSNTDPIDLLCYALRQKNIPLAERAMQALSYRMDHLRWLDQVVEKVAAIGSVSAGDLLIENAIEFMNNTDSFEDKVDYVSCLVSNLNRTDREFDNLELVEKLCNSLKATSTHENPKQRILIYNQLNRLYHGIYCTNGEGKWNDKAIDELNEALSISGEENCLHYNLAVCLKDRDESGDAELALRHVLHSIELDEDADDDHIRLACELMYALNDERLSEYLSALEKINPIKAKLLRSKWKR